MIIVLLLQDELKHSKSRCYSIGRSSQWSCNSCGVQASSVAADTRSNAANPREASDHRTRFAVGLLQSCVNLGPWPKGQLKVAVRVGSWSVSLGAVFLALAATQTRGWEMDLLHTKTLPKATKNGPTLHLHKTCRSNFWQDCLVFTRSTLLHRYCFS